MNTLNFGENEVKIWEDFVSFFNLSKEQDEKLKKYLNLAKNLVNKAKFGMLIQT
jgi:hypothetical protein